MAASGESSRMFVALPLPEEVKLRLKEAQANLRLLLAGGVASWPRPENLHLTIRFLGMVANDRCDALKSALSSVADQTPPLDLVAGQIGCFPNVRHPRVVWAGIRDGVGGLPELFRRVNVAVASFTGEPSGKEFVGHVTLARLKEVRRPDAERLAGFLDRSAERRFGSWRAGSLMLMASELRPEGSRYTCLGELPFGAGAEPHG